MPEVEQESRLRALAENPDDTELEPAERAMVRYALRLTRTPAEVGATEIAALRAAGFDDRGIHDLCSIVAYYAFVNRIADGLGVEMEAPEPPAGR